MQVIVVGGYLVDELMHNVDYYMYVFANLRFEDNSNNIWESVGDPSLHDRIDVDSLRDGLCHAYLSVFMLSEGIHSDELTKISNLQDKEQEKKIYLEDEIHDRINYEIINRLVNSLKKTGENDQQKYRIRIVEAIMNHSGVDESRQKMLMKQLLLLK